MDLIFPIAIFARLVGHFNLNLLWKEELHEELMHSFEMHYSSTKLYANEIIIYDNQDLTNELLTD